jgi:hypothetical protein
MYTFDITSNPAMCEILKDGVVIDRSGPWESVVAAEDWAMQFTEKCNAGYTPFTE